MLPFIQKKLQDNRLVIDGALSPHGNARSKVEQDIAFPRPNTMLIEHYQSMLKSRESVLKWLLDGCDDETSYLPDQRSA
jgi:hypothetical protein